MFSDPVPAQADAWNVREVHVVHLHSYCASAQLLATDKATIASTRRRGGFGPVGGVVDHQCGGRLAQLPPFHRSEPGRPGSSPPAVGVSSLMSVPRWHGQFNLENSLLRNFSFCGSSAWVPTTCSPSLELCERIGPMTQRGRPQIAVEVLTARSSPRAIQGCGHLVRADAITAGHVGDGQTEQ